MKQSFKHIIYGIAVFISVTAVLYMFNFSLELISGQYTYGVYAGLFILFMIPTLTVVGINHLLTKKKHKESN